MIYSSEAHSSNSTCSQCSPVINRAVPQVSSRSSSIVIVGNMTSELSESVKSQIAILSKEGLSQCQIMAGHKVSKGAVCGTGERSGRSKINT